MNVAIVPTARSGKTGKIVAAREAARLIRTGDTERDILENTQRFAKVIEQMIREHPEQWVWIHARWKNRPKGEPPIYDFL